MTDLHSPDANEIDEDEEGQDWIYDIIDYGGKIMAGLAVAAGLSVVGYFAWKKYQAEAACRQQFAAGAAPIVISQDLMSRYTVQAVNAEKHPRGASCVATTDDPRAVFQYIEWNSATKYSRAMARHP